MLMKDEILETLASGGANVAQFVSFDPQGRQRFARIRGYEAGHPFSSAEEAVRAIHATQGAKNVNIRTFLPEKPDGNPFLYGPKHGFDVPEYVAKRLRELLSQGYHAIVNETIDEADGGFSGVLFGDLFEFASRDIPRCVDKPGCAALPRALSFDLIRTVYGFDFHVPYAPGYRLECSVHPGAVGYLGQRQIVWQAERIDGIEPPRAAPLRWPNRYSRDMGDKAYGLLMAHLLGFPVPRTRVFGRVVPFFAFGRKTWNGGQAWMRTCPTEQQPGLFTTVRGWLDPFKLMQREDPDGSRIASILVQDGIRSDYAGAAITCADGGLEIEGRRGYGDGFMLGEKPEALPQRVRSAVESLWSTLRSKLGDARFEWVFDGDDPWIVQLHAGRSESSGSVIYPGTPETFWTFDVREGLERLRELVVLARLKQAGIVLKGDVGLTSHFGDLLRRNAIPSRIERK